MGQKAPRAAKKRCLCESVGELPELIFDLAQEPLVPDDNTNLSTPDISTCPRSAANRKLFMWFGLPVWANIMARSYCVFITCGFQTSDTGRQGTLTREMRQLFGNSLKARGLPFATR